MSKRAKNTSASRPVGLSVTEDIDFACREDEELRLEMARLEPFERLARLVLRRRSELGLSQEDLAARMGTTASSISRIESGQHETQPKTLRKLAEALGGEAVVGLVFDDEPTVRRRDLVTL